MNTSQYKINEAQASGTCTHPTLGDRLSAYLADPVESPAAEEVEDHLLECRYCREFFLMVLSIRGEARMAKKKRAGANGHSSNDEKVLRLADFRKECP